jgi:hypothetical protein
MVMIPAHTLWPRMQKEIADLGDLTFDLRTRVEEQERVIEEQERRIDELGRRIDKLKWISNVANE